MSAGVNSGTGTNPQVFAPAVAAALVIVGVLSVLFYVVFSAYAPETDGEFDGRANALSKSAVGYAALAEFLREQDIPVIISRGLSDSQYEKASLVILTPPLGTSKSDILDVTAREPKLVILPKWTVLPDFLHPGWVSKAGSYDVSRMTEGLLKSLSDSTELKRAEKPAAAYLHSAFDKHELATGSIESLQTISGPEWVGYVEAIDQGFIVSRLMGSQMYVLADPDLLNTRGLHDIDTARAAVDIIQTLRANKGPVVFDLTLNGYRRSPNLLRLIFEPPLLGATLCALFAALLLGTRAAVRFGAPAESKRLFAFGKQALADNSAALIAMAHREHRIVPRYAAAIRRRVARAVGVPADQRDDVLNAQLDRLRPKTDTGEPLSAMVAEAGTAHNEADALRSARKLYRWRREMIHER